LFIYTIPTIEISSLNVGSSSLSTRTSNINDLQIFTFWKLLNCATFVLQFIGAPFTEAKLLRIARTVERELNFWSVEPRLSVLTK
jgi:hypothetical protein